MKLKAKEKKAKTKTKSNTKTKTKTKTKSKTKTKTHSKDSTKPAKNKKISKGSLAFGGKHKKSGTKSKSEETHESAEKSRDPKKKRKYLKIALLALGALIILATIIAIIIFFALSGVKPEVENKEPIVEEVCATESCLKLSATMLKYMDKSVKPCDDFFGYACGRFPTESVEILEVTEEKAKKVSEYFEIYPAKTRSERIAKVLFVKCQSVQSNDDYKNPEVWKRKDLTDILIEMAKLAPNRARFFKNYVFPTEIVGEKRVLNLYVGSDLLMGEDDRKTELEQAYFDVLKQNPHLKTEEIVTNNGDGINLKNFNLRKYFLGLLPDEIRSTNPDWQVTYAKNEILALDMAVGKIGLQSTINRLSYSYATDLKSYFFGYTKDECYKSVEKLFPGTLGMMYIKSFVKKGNVEIADELLEEIKGVFIETIDENSWMDSGLKHALKKEVEALKGSIGRPDEHEDPANIERMYARVEKSKKAEDQSFYELVRNIMAMNSEETFMKVFNKEQITYFVNPLKTSPNYYGGSHRTSFPAVLMDFPYIDENLPEWNKIASIGFMMAHEVGHAFDANLFPLTGALLNHTMSAGSKAEFEKRVNCIVRKYSNYEFDNGVKSDGERTKGEDTADKIGFDLSYRLFKKLRNYQKLPGFEDLTIEQQYFHRLALDWCGKTPLPDKWSKHFQETDVHSAYTFRVRGMMSNSVDFARAYGCPLNSDMNPAKKCPMF